MILTRGKPHFFSSSAISLEGESFLWKLAWEHIAARFPSKTSNAGRKFSIEDRAYVERSQKSLKVDKKISVKKWRIVVLKKWAFVGRFFVFVFYCWAHPGSYGFSGLPEMDFPEKKKIFTKNRSGNPKIVAGNSLRSPTERPCSLSNPVEGHIA